MTAKRLTAEELATGWGMMAGRNLSKAADELRGHIEALEEELAMLGDVVGRIVAITHLPLAPGEQSGEHPLDQQIAVQGVLNLMAQRDRLTEMVRKLEKNMREIILALAERDHLRADNERLRAAAALALRNARDPSRCPICHRFTQPQPQYPPAGRQAFAPTCLADCPGAKLRAVLKPDGGG